MRAVMQDASAVPHDEDTIGQRQVRARVMVDGHHRPPPCRPGQGGHERRVRPGVELGGRLVEHQHRLVLRESGGQGQALLLAARQPHRVALTGQVGQQNVVEQAQGPGSGGASRPAGVVHGQAHLVQQRRGAHLGARVLPDGGHPCDVDRAADPPGALPGQGQGQGGLAAAGRPADEDVLPRGHVEIQAPEEPDASGQDHLEPADPHVRTRRPIPARRRRSTRRTASQP